MRKNSEQNRGFAFAKQNGSGACNELQSAAICKGDGMPQVRKREIYLPVINPHSITTVITMTMMLAPQAIQFHMREFL